MLDLLLLESGKLKLYESSAFVTLINPFNFQTTMWPFTPFLKICVGLFIWEYSTIFSTIHTALKVVKYSNGLVGKEFFNYLGFVFASL